MIQRIQSVWLFLAALVAASTLYFDFYKLPNGLLLNLQSNYVGIMLIGAIVIICLIALFSFKKRNNQLNLIWLAILCIIGLLVWLFVTINKHTAPLADATSQGSYRIGAFIPIIALVLLFMARAGIRKDIKLLKAYDRLR